MNDGQKSLTLRNCTHYVVCPKNKQQDSEGAMDIAQIFYHFLITNITEGVKEGSICFYRSAIAMETVHDSTVMSPTV